MVLTTRKELPAEVDGSSYLEAPFGLMELSEEG